MLTNNELKQIKDYLALYGKKDSQLEAVNVDFNYPEVTFEANDYLSVVQDSKNKIIKIKDLEKVFLLTFLTDEDFREALKGKIPEEMLENACVTTEKLADGAVTTIKLGDNAVTTAKIATGAITGDKIANNTIQGTAFATNSITTDKIVDGTVTGDKLADGSIQSVDIKDNTLSGSKFVDGSISGSKIQDDAIESKHLLDNSIPASKIKDGSIESVDIKDGTLDGAKIKDNTIESAKLANNAITTDKIIDNSITTSKIANDAVTEDKIVDDSITTAKIANSSVTTDKIVNEAITEDKLANGAVTTAKLADGLISEIQNITDAVPTADSVKPVQSGGVKTAIDNVAFLTNEKVIETGIDNEPTAGSENLVKSGGVAEKISQLCQYDIALSDNKYLYTDGSVKSIDIPSFSVTDYILAIKGLVISGIHPASDANLTYLCFYNSRKEFISALVGSSTSTFELTLTEEIIPSDAIFFRVTVNGSLFGLSMINNPNYADTIINYANQYSVSCGNAAEKKSMLSSDGNVLSHDNWSNYNVTEYFPAVEGTVIKGAFYISGQSNIVVAFYDKDRIFVGSLNENTSNDLTIGSEDIPQGAIFARANLRNDGKILLPIAYLQDLIQTRIDNLKRTEVQYHTGMLINAKGIEVAAGNSFKATGFVKAIEGTKINNIKVPDSSASYTYLCFYDKNFRFISRLYDQSRAITSLVLSSEIIPEGAIYFRANLKGGEGNGWVNVQMSRVLNDSDCVSYMASRQSNPTTALFDYSVALTMDRSELRCIVETASNGKATVIYDEDGYPSLMYKIPKVSIGAFIPSLGELTDVHPAFIVNNVEKDCIYVGIYLTSEYNGHYVSWGGLQPKGHINLPDWRSKISAKGAGWHLETVYERALIVMLANYLNSPTPTGNTNRGMSHINPWEYCQLKDGYLPGTSLPGRTGIEWINGTQPAVWSHNKEQWGIQDVIGGYHEICDLMKLVHGKIYIAPDNKFFSTGDNQSSFESSWIDTGAVYDMIDGSLILSDRVTSPTVSEGYDAKKYTKLLSTDGYDSLSEATRKKLCLLFLASRMQSSDSDAILPSLGGSICVNNTKDLCYGVFGGAEEYVASGLAFSIMAYPIDDDSITGHNAHYNMGSRMVYIP